MDWYPIMRCLKSFTHLSKWPRVERRGASLICQDSEQVLFRDKIYE